MQNEEKKTYLVTAHVVREEVWEVKANSREDALENYDSDGSLVEDDDEAIATRVMGVELRGAPPAFLAYSVLLAYPQPNDNGEPETFYTHVYAQTVTQAVYAAREEAVASNVGYERADFYPLLVLAGHVEAEAYGGDQNWKEEDGNAQS